MKAKRFIALALAIIMVFSLVACSGGAGGGGNSKPSPVGKYTLSGMEEDGQATSQEDLDLLSSLGLTVTVEVKEDGTGMIDLFGEQLEFTWDDTYITIDDQQQTYEFDGTTLSMENEGTKMTFTKDTE